VSRFRKPLHLLLRASRISIGVAIVATLAVVSSVTRAPDTDARAAGTFSFGAENSWIRVQNIGNANANVEVDYFDEAGRIAGKDACPSPSCPVLYPGSGWTFFQRDNQGLPSGFQGSAIVSTDQPVVAIMAKDVTRGASFAIAGDTVTTGQGSHRIFLPITAKRDGAQSDWNGRFAIQT
jgi:hypothetical protein